jgi:hypothetical protein
MDILHKVTEADSGLTVAPSACIETDDLYLAPALQVGTLRTKVSKYVSQSVLGKWRNTTLFQATLDLINLFRLKLLPSKQGMTISGILPLHKYQDGLDPVHTPKDIEQVEGFSKEALLATSSVWIPRHVFTDRFNTATPIGKPTWNTRFSYYRHPDNGPDKAGMIKVGVVPFIYQGALASKSSPLDKEYRATPSKHTDATSGAREDIGKSLAKQEYAALDAGMGVMVLTLNPFTNLTTCLSEVGLVTKVIRPTITGQAVENNAYIGYCNSVRMGINILEGSISINKDLIQVRSEEDDNIMSVDPAEGYGGKATSPESAEQLELRGTIFA